MIMGIGRNKDRNPEEQTEETTLLQRLQQALPVGFEVVGDLQEVEIPPVVQIRAPRGSQNAFAVVDEALFRARMGRVDMRTYQDGIGLVVLVNGCHVSEPADAETEEES